MPTSIRSRFFLPAALAAVFALGAVLPGASAEDASEPTAVRNALAQSSSVQGAPGRWC